MPKIEFVSYNGEYPCLCMGELKLKIDGQIVNFGKYCLTSGGSCRFTDDSYSDFEIEEKPYEDIDLSKHPEYEPYKKEILEVVNENVLWGCCGGCL